MLPTLAAAALPAQVKRRISIATASTGSVFYPLGGAIAALITRYVSGVEATAEMTGGAVDNIRLLEAGRVALALTHGHTAWASREGRLRGLPGRVDVRAILGLHSGHLHIVTLRNSRIQSIRDLRSQRIAAGTAGSDQLWMTVLDTAGIPLADVRQERLGVAESAGALKDGRIAAFFWFGRAPVPAITELAATPGVSIRLVPNGELAGQIAAAYGPMCTAGVIPRGSYKGVDADVPVITARNLLVTHARVDEPLVHAISRTLIDKLPELQSMSRYAEGLNARSLSTDSPIPWHAGALRFFRERRLAA